MDDVSHGDPGAARLRALTHDLRGAIGALQHQTQLLADRQLDAQLHQRSIAALDANIAELRRVVEQLEVLAHPSAPGST